MMGISGSKFCLLEGIRILDLADEKASFCSKLLADMGASVIKLERPGGGPSRNIGPFTQGSPSTRQSLFFAYHNMNKWAITLDITKEQGRQIFLRLLKTHDIVVETFPPGYLAGLGLGYNALSESNPGLILASVTGFGQKGPRSGYKSCDLVASAFGGQMYVTGSPSTPPLKAFGEQSYYTASLYATIAILLAARKRRESGKGEHIDISLQEAVVSTLDHVVVRYFYDEVVPKRQGVLSWNNGSSILPCRDGYIFITMSQQWETLVEWMESEGMASDLKDERWKDEEYRRTHIDHLLEIMERWTRTHTTGELFELGQLMRFPWAPVQSPRQMLASPQLEARGFFVEAGNPSQDAPLQYPGAPYRFSNSDPCQPKRAPLIGEHNIRIYQEELGLTDAEMESLSRNGVI